MAKKAQKNDGKWASVFASHPNATQIYVAAGVPFLKEKDARNYAATKKVEVETINANEVAKEAPEGGGEANTKPQD